MKNIFFCLFILLFTIQIGIAQSVNFTFDIVKPTCGKANGSITAIMVDTAGLKYFYWMHGETKLTAKYLTANIYTFVYSINNNERKENIYLSDVDGPKIKITIKDESCSGRSDGSISLERINKIDPVYFNWIQSGKTDSVIKDLLPYNYTVLASNKSGCLTIHDIKVNTIPALNTSISIVPPRCGLNDGKIISAIKGGTNPYSIYISRLDSLVPALNTITNDSVKFENLFDGIYKIIVLDSNKCRNENVVTLQSKGADSILLITTAELDFVIAKIDSPFYIRWTDTTTHKFFSDIPKPLFYSNTNYILRITDANNCSLILLRGKNPIGWDPPFPPTQICLISVDSVSGNNVVIWKKHDASYNVKYYEILRETFVPNLFMPLDSVSYNQLSIWTDTVYNPLKRSWKYRIVGHRESSISGVAESKSMHLSLQQDSSAAPVHLTWDKYIHVNTIEYLVYRGNADSVICIDTVKTAPFPFITYVDLNPPPGYLYYYIAVDLGTTCNPLNLKGFEGPYSRSLSNLEDNRMKGDTTSIPNKTKNVFSSDEVSLYPNPANDKLFLVSAHDKITIIRIFNSNGKMIMIKKYDTGTTTCVVDINDLSVGLYIIQYSIDGKSLFKKFSKINN